MLVCLVELRAGPSTESAIGISDPVLGNPASTPNHPASHVFVSPAGYWLQFLVAAEKAVVLSYHVARKYETNGLNG